MTRLEYRGAETMSSGAVCCVMSAGADQARHWRMVVSAAERGGKRPSARMARAASTFEGDKERSRCEGEHGRKGGKGKKGSKGGENTSKDEV